MMIALAVTLAGLIVLIGGAAQARATATVPTAGAAVISSTVAAPATSTAAAPATAGAGPALSVDATATGEHAISPDIYGINFAPAALAGEIDLPVDRWGGDSSDTYNYLIGADNTGADYYFENVSDCWTAALNYCSGDKKNTVFAYRDQIAQDRSTGTTTLLNLPLVGYVANSAPVTQPLPCSYPVSEYPTQDSFDPYDPTCGDGLDDGVVIPGSPAIDGRYAGTAFDRGWVESLVKQYGTAANGGVGIYELGNEPSLWGQTHSDFHPKAETAAELWDKSRAVATAVKDVDPSAQVLGFSEWGWPGYFCSEADTYGNGCGESGCTTSPDCAHHGDLPMAEWYLQQFARYDKLTGVRHLDYFDVHYYAQGGDSPDVTRSLWDPTYTDPSWIDTDIDLIPRMKCWIDGYQPGLCPNSPGYYPGTKIAISEYNLSVAGVSDATNAIIEADTLGIFAREGVDLATRWALPTDGALVDDAFLMYRDYDGQGSKFGDTWIPSTSADQSQLAVYGAQRSSDGAYTILVLNKTNAPLTSPLTLTGIANSGTAQTWQWTGAAITQLPGGTPIASNVITATYPAMSMTMYVIG